MFRIASLCLVALLAGVYAVPPGQHSRIINGKPIQIEDIPYLVQLRNNWSNQFVCGGTLVTPNHVVTAAHCIYGREQPIDLWVVGGATSRYDAGVKRNVVKGFVHPYYNEGVSHTHDVAVLKLDFPMEGPNIGTVKLCTGFELPVGADLQVSGWGETEEGHGSDIARTVTVSTTSFEECKKQYSYTQLSQTMMCASVPGEKDACQGDSGGPAIYNDKLCGIVSLGTGCAQANFPGIYTIVGTVSAFIEGALRE